MINGGVEMNTTQKDNYISPDEYEYYSLNMTAKQNMLMGNMGKLKHC